MEYFKKRASLAEEYARGLQKLQRNYSPPLAYEVGMEDLLGTTNALVEAHLLLSEQVSGSLVEGLRTTVREHDKARREVLTLIRSVRADWKRTLTTLEKARKARDSAIRAAEEARIAFDRASNDKNVTRAYVEKMRDEYASKARRMLLCKEEYIQTARTIRPLQNKHYDTDLAGLFDQLQQIEEQRLTKVRRHLIEFGELVSRAVTEEASCVRRMVAKWEQFAPASLIDAFIANAKGDRPFYYPENFDLDDAASVESLGLAAAASSAHSRKPSFGGGAVVAPEAGTVDALAARSRLEELRREQSVLERQRDGVQSLADLYERQPELADAQTRIEAARQLSNLLDRLGALSIEQEALEAQLVADPQALESDATCIRATPDAGSLVLWEETGLSPISGPISSASEPATSPRPGAPNSCLTAIQCSSQSGGRPAKPHRAAAIFDFDPTDPEHELSLKVGDLVTILSDEGEWWYAQTEDGRLGYVPFNYVHSQQ